MPPHFLAKRRGKSGLLFVGCLLVSGLASYQFASWAGQPGARPPNVPQNSEVSRPTPLIPSPAKLDLGALAKGGNASTTFWLHNPTERTVNIEEVRTSCDCLDVSMDAKTIFPGQKIIACAKIDLSDDPTFLGKLRLEARGFARSEAALQPSGLSDDQAGCVFLVYVDAEVSP
jgi:hypothetical protein